MPKAIRDRIEEIQAQIQEARAAVHSKGDAITRAADSAATRLVTDLGAQLVTAITDGAKPCRKCGAAPHGMVHPAFVKGQARAVYEVGCLPCKNLRALDLLPELAVERWNAQDFEAPSAGPGAHA